ncbi:PREDICTED: uncharacterized protein LOC109128658 [Camelina sativa]|uniref:Uncharacterized protein LOC109128658 n=1 Tax=Camelina sativa TaxID=90675 RepID=A0ABM1QW87_CAMSA|nr:PREDICTED: uncharacterized protein LOC109128658 [Camelina sativa]
MTNVTKLTPTNYLMWKLQVHALVDGYGLVGHLDGSTSAPSRTITSATVVSDNPAYVNWKRQDKLIYSALLGAISLNVQPILSRTTTSSEIWSTLAETYAKGSRGHGLTTRFDTLANLGKPMDHDDQIDLILAGLPEDYRPIIDQIEARDVSPTLTYVHERLRTREAKLLSKATLITLPMTANVASHRPSNNNNNNYRSNNQHKQRSNTQNSHWQSSSPRSDQRQSRPYMGKCQFCNTHGHSARRCPQLQNHISLSRPQHGSPFTSWQPRANLALGASNHSDPWTLDSGATHHITSDLQNLSLHQPYSATMRF